MAAADGAGGGGGGSGVETAFLLLDGHAEYHIKQLRDEIDAAGFAVTREARLQLSEAQATAVLELEVAAGTEAAEAASAAGKGGGKKAPAKGKGATGGAGAPVSEVRPAEAASLSAAHEKVVVLGLTKVDAVGELRARVGPSSADQWAAAPGCWAGAFTCAAARCAYAFPVWAANRYMQTAMCHVAGCRYAAAEGEAPYRVLHVAVSAAHAARFWVIIDEIELLCKTLSETAAPRVEKSHWVDVSSLMPFLFPSGQQHPRSTGRLIVFSMFGPFNSAGQLTSGICGRHVATDSELRTMIDAFEQEDILSIYVRDKGLSAARQREVLADVDAAKTRLPNMNPEQVEALFAPLPRSVEGLVSFHDIQRCAPKRVCVWGGVPVALSECGRAFALPPRSVDVTLTRCRGCRSVVMRARAARLRDMKQMYMGGQDMHSRIWGVFAIALANGGPAAGTPP